MRFTVKKKNPWRRWFAIYPVELDEGGWVWLETIERKIETGPYCTFVNHRDITL